MIVTSRILKRQSFVDSVVLDDMKMLELLSWHIVVELFIYLGSIIIDGRGFENKFHDDYLNHIHTYIQSIQSM